MNKSYAVIGLILVVGIGAYVFFIKTPDVQQAAPDTQGSAVPFDPLNTSYDIDGERVLLTNGLSEVPVAPGAATLAITRVFGEPVFGDLNGDGAKDAAFVLIDTPGGTGTFYYLAVALKTPQGAQGMSALYLGDRIAPQNVEIRNGMVIANYADRKPNDPMSAKPSVGVSAYGIIENGNLKDVSAADGKSRPVAGMLTFAHEARSFTPCGEKEQNALWIAGQSPALNAVRDQYAAATKNTQPYTPVFAILTGYQTTASEEFARDYTGAFSVQNVERVDAAQKCE